MKVSVFKNKYVLVAAQHIYEMDRFIIKQFESHHKAADFLEDLVREDSNEQS